MKFKILNDCYCEQYLHELYHYPRKGLIEKKLYKDDIVEFKEIYKNYFGSFYRVLKNDYVYDILEKNLVKI